MNNSFCLHKRCKSFVYAFRGIGCLIRTQHNARIHLLATIVVVGLGFYFDVSKTDWIFLTIAIAGVWITEALNTSIEMLCDHVTQEIHPLIGKSKDVAAGAVLDEIDL